MKRRAVDTITGDLCLGFEMLDAQSCEEVRRGAALRLRCEGLALRGAGPVPCWPALTVQRLQPCCSAGRRRIRVPLARAGQHHWLQAAWLMGP
jgi:hypothetical protein